MAIETTEWLPPAIGVGVGLSNGMIEQKVHIAHAAPLFRLALFSFGLVRELMASPGSQSAVAIDVNYSLMSATLALEATHIPQVFQGAGIGALAMTSQAASLPGRMPEAHAHGASCSTCASRRPVVAAPLLTPTESLRGYHGH